MKKTFVLVLVAGLFVTSLIGSVQAELLVRGTDTLGNKLIYDTDLDITWYDYSHGNGVTSIYELNSWASDLTVSFNETILDYWRLPKK